MELLRMPRASENMTEGTVGPWLVHEGERVEAGAPVVEIITEKAQFELECERGGVLAAVFAVERATVPVDFVLGVLVEEGEEWDRAAIERENDEIVRAHLAAALGDASLHTRAARRPTARKGATPRARRLARSAGVSLDEVRAALGVEGVIEEKHVREFLSKRDDG